MLRLLFPRLTAEPAPGADLFRSVSERAREQHWYLAGGVADTVDGRFAMLATVMALAMVRLERDGNAGDQMSVALTERFIEVMESEHREMGLGDPKLGRVVRKLVGSLARRVEAWRAAIDGHSWDAAVSDSVFGAMQPAAKAFAHTATQLRDLWIQLESAPLDAISKGRLE